ncbi:ABC transporter permease [Boudabousia marimammalium]|uniref:ABC transporter permease n=1 Tax=Boudabousia marimammalium TaxID=156892 RepID=UPI001301086D|nr:ABC transporter permease [Boudabousia marimammalium]
MAIVAITVMLGVSIMTSLVSVGKTVEKTELDKLQYDLYVVGERDSTVNENAVTLKAPARVGIDHETLTIIEKQLPGWQVVPEAPILVDLKIGDHVLRSGIQAKYAADRWSAYSDSLDSVIEGEFSNSPGEIVVDRYLFETLNLSLGYPIQVISGSKTAQGRVVAVISNDSAPKSEHHLYLSDADRDKLVRSEQQINRIGLAPDGSESLTLEQVKTTIYELPGLELRTQVQLRDEIKDGFQRQLNSLTIVALLLVLSALVAVYLSTNSINYLLTIESDRLKELQILGMSRKQVIGLTLRRFLSAGVIAGLTGVLLSVPSSIAINRLFFELGLPPIRYRFSILVAVVGLATSIIIFAVSAAVAAARYTSTKNRKETDVNHVKLNYLHIVGFVSLGAVALALLFSADARLKLILSFLLYLAGILVSGYLVSYLLLQVQRLTGRKRVALALSLNSLLNDRKRLSFGTVAIMLASGVVISGLFVQASLEKGISKTITEELKAPYLLTTYADTETFNEDITKIRNLPNVASVDGSTGLFVAPLCESAPSKNIESQAVNVNLLDFESFSIAASLPLVDGSLDNLLADNSRSSDFAILNQSYASDRGFRIGDRISISDNEGHCTTVKIGAIVDSHLLHGELIIPKEVARGGTFRQIEPSVLMVTPNDGKDIEEDLIQYTRTHSDYNLVLKQTYVDETSRQTQGLFVFLITILGVSFLVAVSGLVYLQLVATRRQFPLLATAKAMGMSTWQLFRTSMYETLIIVFFGVIVGVPIGVVGGHSAVLLLKHSNVIPVLFSVPSAGSISVFAIVLGIVSTGLSVPAWMLARQLTIVEALRPR